VNNVKNKYKWELNRFGFISDIKASETYYARMAEKGWMVDKIGVLFYRYKAVEPCQKRFYVDILPQTTVFDHPENEDAQNYRSICEDSGWEFAASYMQVNVFCADADNPAPVPIHTDNKIQAQTYLKFCRKYELLPFMVLNLVLVWILLTFPLIDNGEIIIFQNNADMMIAFGLLLLLAGSLCMTFYLILYYRRIKKSAGLNLPLPAANYRLSHIRTFAFMAVIVISWICMIAGVVVMMTGVPFTAAGLVLFFGMLIIALGCVFWIERQIRVKRRERKENIRMTVIAIVITALSVSVLILAVTLYVILKEIVL